MDSNPNHDLIVKILSKTADEKEQEEFRHWLQQSEDNRKLYQQYGILWERMDHSYDHLNFDTHAARIKIREKIRHQQLRKQTIRMRSWISAAASILILVGAGYLIRQLPVRTNAEVLVYTTQEDQIMEIVLPDSSQVWLNENSRLQLHRSYHQTQRKVFLEGEAYFEVTKDSRHPFKVETGNTLARVLGTSFSLKSMENDRVSLIVNTGRVQFYKKNSLQKKTIFTAGQMGILDVRQDKLVKSFNRDLNYLSWKTGVLTFSATPLSEVCRTLSNHFEVPVDCGVNDPDLSLTGTFKNESLEDILSTIELTLDIRTSKSAEGVSLHN